MREALRNPITVLKNLSEKSCDKEYKFQRLYRNLYNPEFYLLAYRNIYTSPGNMTPGTDGKTLTGMSMERIEAIIASLKDHSYQPNPARRTYITKKNSDKKRPLGIPSTDDKLVQEVVRMILESIYEPTFSDVSHGFRPKRSCHTALQHIQANFTSVRWFVEGDIKACFDSFDHHVLINIIRRRIDDEHFIALLWKFLKAGYMEQWEYHTTYSGTPQGSGVSPILANIYLNELDTYMEEYKKNFDAGADRRNASSQYRSVRFQYQKLKYRYDKIWDTLSETEKANAKKEVKAAKKRMLKTSYQPAGDPNYRRLQYNRYCDDYIIGIIGSKADAQKIKADIKEFLQEKLKLTMSEEKTKITHSSELVRYLGYDLAVARDNSLKKDANGVLRRCHNGHIKLFVPKDKWVGKLIEYKAFKIKTDENGKEKWCPTYRGKLINKSDVDIIGKYNSEIRGIYNYYRLACNVSVLNKFAYIMRSSMYKTYASKYNSTVRKIVRKYSKDGEFGIDYTTKAGKKRCVLHQGFTMSKIPAKFDADVLPPYVRYDRPNSIAARLKSGVCEYCGDKTTDIRMHHVRNLKELTGKTLWETIMMEKHRKTLALCPICFEKLHDNILP